MWIRHPSIFGAVAGDWCQELNLACMRTRTSLENSLVYDPEIERTIRLIRRQKKQTADMGDIVDAAARAAAEAALAGNVANGANMAFGGDVGNNQIPPINNQAGMGIDPARQTLRQHARPNVAQPALGIQYPMLDGPFELKSGLIQLLPTFSGAENEDPHTHLKEFHVVCSSFQPNGVSEEQVKLRAFPFSLRGQAKDWLFYLNPGSINTWDDMVTAFYDKFFPASRAATLRREICSIRQKDIETLHEYWERYKRLCSRCPQHGLSDQTIIQYFIEGMLPMERSTLNAASGGDIFSKTAQEARNLITAMAENSRQYSKRADADTRQVHEVSQMQTQLNTLTQMVGQLIQGKACGICAAKTHHTDACPVLQDDLMESANAIGGFNQNQRRYDPYSTTYNPGWRDHPNFRWGNRQPNYQNNPQPHQQSQNQATETSSLEDMVKSLALNQQKFQQCQ